MMGGAILGRYWDEAGLPQESAELEARARIQNGPQFEPCDGSAGNQGEFFRGLFFVDRARGGAIIQHLFW